MISPLFITRKSLGVPTTSVNHTLLYFFQAFDIFLLPLSCHIGKRGRPQAPVNKDLWTCLPGRLREFIWPVEHQSVRQVIQDFSRSCSSPHLFTPAYQVVTLVSSLYGLTKRPLQIWLVPNHIEWVVFCFWLLFSIWIIFIAQYPNVFDVYIRFSALFKYLTGLLIKQNHSLK